jgi:hypothetical protein
MIAVSPVFLRLSGSFGISPRSIRSGLGTGAQGIAGDRATYWTLMRHKCDSPTHFCAMMRRLAGRCPAAP